MSEDTLSDATIAAMSGAQRRDLIRRLERPLAEVMPTSVLQRVRRIRLVLMIGAAIALVPWIVYLAFTLPDKYTTYNWTATWVGFDILLLIFIVATAVLGLLHRWLLILTAALAELPLAVILIGGALRILRLTATRLWLLDPHMRLWQVPMLPCNGY